MAEFIEACTQSPVNLVLSVLLAMTMLYWIVVIIGAVGMDSLDFDFDADADFDADIDADAEGSLMHVGLGAGILRFFHIGTVPILVLWSIFIVIIWLVGVISYPLFGSWGWILQALVVIPMFIVAMLITKLVTLPLKVLFEKMKAQEEAEQHVDLIGERCNVVSLTVDHKHGQVEIVTDGAPLRLNVVTSDPHTTLNKGDEAVLIAKDEARGAYIIRGF